MKIDNLLKPVGGPVNGSRNAAVKSQSGAVSMEVGTAVALSPLSAQLQGVADTLANTPAVDLNRVAEIKQAIAEGRFTMDPGKIADGLLESVRQMLVAQH